MFFIIKSDQKNRDTFKNWILIENPHFLSDLHENLRKKSSYKMIIFAKFHEDLTKDVDFFLLKANF